MFAMVVANFFGMKKILRFLGLPGVGAWMIPVYKAEDMPWDGMASHD
jgi:hypothetical protein